MTRLNHFPLLSSVFCFLSLISFVTSATTDQFFFQCLTSKSNDDRDISNVIFTPANRSYSSILDERIRNLRFNTTVTPKPLAIVTPLRASHVQATIRCARKQGLQIRIRSGGHDYEGLSYVSPLPFVVIDLTNLRNVTVDVENKVAWVESGATLVEFYYGIGKKSRTLGFPAGVCPTVGIGGYFSGGGYGFLLRKFGLAADNVVDALLVDVNGDVLDRACMGEDLFWAIRGGGGNTFGVVISWKVNLVPVPPKVTTFSITRTLDQNATQLLHKWQYVVNKLPDDINIYAGFYNSSSTRFASFSSLYLGGTDILLQLMEERFPELGLKRENCSEMSWVESQLSLAGYPSNTSLETLLKRTNTTRYPRGIFKSKSDYVKEPMSEAALEGLLKLYSNEGMKIFYMVPYGGKMDEIAETSIPFPHRAGNLYMIAYYVIWNEQGAEATKKNTDWIRRVYDYMTPYVSENPREAYLNYRDLEIGTNNLSGNTSYQIARTWGTKYFKNNFDRLVRVKTKVDPSNFSEMNRASLLCNLIGNFIIVYI